MGKYAKAIVAFLVAAGTVAVAAFSDSTITPAEWLGIVLAGLGAIGVYAVPNKPDVPDAVRAVRDRSGV